MGDAISLIGAKKNTIKQRRITMEILDEYVFQVKGSSAEPYTVRFIRRSEDNIAAYCDCMAGQKGMHCKHRIRILQGNTKDIISENADEVKHVASWLPGSDIENTLQKIEALEIEIAKIKKQLAAAKKELAQKLLN